MRASVRLPRIDSDHGLSSPAVLPAREHTPSSTKSRLKAKGGTECGTRWAEVYSHPMSKARPGPETPSTSASHKSSDGSNSIAHMRRRAAAAVRIAAAPAASAVLPGPDGRWLSQTQHGGTKRRPGSSDSGRAVVNFPDIGKESVQSIRMNLTYQPVPHAHVPCTEAKATPSYLERTLLRAERVKSLADRQSLSGVAAKVASEGESARFGGPSRALPRRPAPVVKISKITSRRQIQLKELTNTGHVL